MRGGNETEFLGVVAGAYARPERKGRVGKFKCETTRPP
jgi:hypothetical protein